jgi:hypothetical protein
VRQRHIAKPHRAASHPTTDKCQLLWNGADAEAIAQAMAEWQHAKSTRIAMDRAAAVAVAIWQITSAGFNPAESRRQIEDVLRDEFLDVARELEACRA